MHIEQSRDCVSCYREMQHRTRQGMTKPDKTNNTRQLDISWAIRDENKTRQVKTRQDKPRQDKTRQDKTD